MPCTTSRRIALPLYCAFLLLIIAAMPVCAAESPSGQRRLVSVGLGFDISSGDYGTDTTTDFVSVPLIVDLYPTERLDLELIIPWVYQSNSNTVYGTTMPYRGGGYGMSTMSAMPRFMSGPGGTSAGGTGSSISNPSASASGLGDITLTAGYIVVQESDLVPRIRPTLYFKFPTADRDKGLGTGEFDAGIGLSLEKWFGDWRLAGEATYVFQGSSDLYQTKDYLNYEAGLGYQLTRQFFCTLLGRGATAPADGSPALFEGRLKGVYDIGDRYSLEAYLSHGFTNGSPDIGGGLALFVDF
ncbi:hypothetical protein GURASL_03970 [Geotalea uraniireducens]|uniref:Transporter n=1 Tax=Geotalea uraniireducens TaxID=351604 RepID=A0ABN6VNI2_9BACT|nr:transporter [Geotalea uraniireducens]BDV41474.1 hypothetical protein GURASL_03970 [Geotalea uraniireducens]